MNPLQNAILALIIIGFGLIEWLSGRHKNFRATRDDSVIDALMFVLLVGFSQPLILAATGMACEWLMPQYRHAWADWPWWGMALVLLLGDDLAQYLWHRASHSPALWPLHRAHHTAHYMSVRITYRNNFFYYLMMPGLYVSGVLIYLGFANVYLFYIVIKLTVIMGAHCAVRWDEPLYRIRALHPLMWVLERTVSTPATHWAHHAMTNQDGIGHYKGNFGNLLFFWDVLFGTAHITRRYPAQVGLRDDQIYGKERWFHETFYPLLRSRRKHSALRPGGRIYSEDDVPVQPVQPGIAPAP